MVEEHQTRPPHHLAHELDVLLDRRRQDGVLLVLEGDDASKPALDDDDVLDDGGDDLFLRCRRPRVGRCLAGASHEFP